MSVLQVIGFLHAMAQDKDTCLLARVDLVRPLMELRLPVYAYLQDASGLDYVLTVATYSELEAAGWPYQSLDTNGCPEDYVVALARQLGAVAAAVGPFQIVHDDSRQWIVRATAEEAEQLAEAGFAIVRLSSEPLIWPWSGTDARAKSVQSWTYETYQPNTVVAAMIDKVQQTNLQTLVSQLSGEEPTVIGGVSYTIARRHTASGVPLQKATQYAYEYLDALGLTVRYHNWSSGNDANRNIEGIQMGTVRSNEIVLVIAHLDDMPSGARAPGADDNASGSAAVLMLAGLFRQYYFDRTLYYVLVTGEEQGLLGSQVYARDVYNAGKNIVAVFNMDMIAWDSDSTPTLRIHTRTPSNPHYADDLVIASIFTNVIATYGMKDQLSPLIVADGIMYSDHYSFWSKGYPGVLAIEDDSADLNAYYHTTNDRLQHLNLSYFTDYVKAAVGTAAHLAGVKAYVVQVETAYGTANVAVDSHVYPKGVTLTNRVGGSPEIHGGATQYICTGWSLLGHEDIYGMNSGTDSQVVIRVTNDMTLTWLWQTNYWLYAEAGPHGSVNATNGWYTNGAVVTVWAQPDVYYHFTNWSGTMMGSAVWANPLSVRMDGSTSNRALFAENVVTHSTPEWWLAGYGLTNGDQWVVLGTYSFEAGTSGYVKIRTDNTSSGYVIADAVRFRPVAMTGVILDNADATGVEIVGRWTGSTSMPGYWSTNYIHDIKTVRTKSVTFRPTLDFAGHYEVSIWYTAGANRATNVPVDIVYAGNSKTVMLNERVNGGQWVMLGTNSFAAGTNGYVRIRTDGTTSGYVIVDAVRFRPVAMTDVILDNADATGVEIVGRWTESTNMPGYWSTNYIHNMRTVKTQSVTFRPNLPFAGDYEVSIRYPSCPTLATNVPMDVVYAGGTCTVLVNESVNGSHNFSEVAMGDADGDGSRNWEEYWANTDPTNPLSVFKMQVSRATNPPACVVKWTGGSNRVYSIFFSTNPAVDEWNNLITGLSVPMGSYTDTVHGTPSKILYRGEVCLPSSP